MTELHDPAFEAFVEDAREGIEREHERGGAAPDFLAMLEKARALDAAAVPDAWIEEAARLAPVIELREGRRLRQQHDDSGMDAIVADVRAAMTHEIGVELARRVRSSDVAEAVPTRRTWALGLAAAALLIIGSAGLLTAKLAERGGESRPLEAVAEHRAPAVESELEARTVERDPAASESTDEDGNAGETDTAEDGIADESAEVSSGDAAAGSSRARASSQSVAERLAALDAEAHAAWKAGDLARARANFETIVAIGGRHRLADLAYGDLFTLARTAGDERREAQLWKAYLRRFPRGRFADDARAGLCRRASSTEQARCWARYLRDMPGGTYRGQAEQALSSVSKEE